MLASGTYIEQQAREAMFRVLSALIALERENVVHRDLKVSTTILVTLGSSKSKVRFGAILFWW